MLCGDDGFLEDFDIHAAGKLVQKHRPSIRLLSDGAYRNADEADDGEQLSERARGAGPCRSASEAAPLANSSRDEVNAEKSPFPDELFKTTFSEKKLGTLAEALKLATDKEVQDSIRLLEEDYTYSIVVTSHKVPHVPVHLSRM